MKKSKIYFTIALLCLLSGAVQLLAAKSNANFSQISIGAVLWALVFFALSNRAKRKALGIKKPEKVKRVKQQKQAKQPKPKKQKAPQVEKPVREAKPALKPSAKPANPKLKHGYLVEVAERLRATARLYEDPLFDEFLTLDGLQIERSTKSQNFRANAILRISRGGFKVQFRNLNSRSSAVREIEKTWMNTIGVTESRFELYLKDHSSIEFIPVDKTTYLFLSVFWQVFHEGLNGSHELFQNPVESGFGHRLREAAGYILEHESEVGPSGEFDLSKVPSRVSAQDFHGFQELRFPEKGDKIQGWRLLSVLGAGGFGQVFKAENIETGKFAAIKLMAPPADQKRKIDSSTVQFRHAKKRFLDEAMLSMKVHSPFVVSAAHCGSEPWPWIRYPLVEGSDIFEFVSRSEDPRLAWWNLAHDLVSALSTIHLEGLVHRDVKPDNMKATEDSFMLLDLGIGEVTGYTGLLNGYGASGTPGFIAPELFLMKQATEPHPSIDIFAAGMTLLSFFDKQELYRVVHLENTFKETRDETAFRQNLTQPVSLEKAPEEARELLKGMIDFNPANRLSANQLLNIIASHVDFEPKIQLMLRHRAERAQILNDKPEPMGSDAPFEKTISGRPASWKVIEDEIAKVITDIRPHYFTVTLNLGAEDLVYVQAMTTGGWYFEAMSEAFMESPQDSRQKVNFLRLNWSPPSASEPNYSMNIGEVPLAEALRIFTDAFEFGYEINLQNVRSVQIQGVGEGTY